MNSLGADVTLNYKTTDTPAVLQREGEIDMYVSWASGFRTLGTDYAKPNSFWDNVGGATLGAALEAANINARFILCLPCLTLFTRPSALTHRPSLQERGGISGYNNNGAPFTKGLNIFAKSISLRLFGFVVFSVQYKYEERLYRKVPKLVAEGKLKYREQVYEGLRSVGNAILEVQKGLNEAKAVVKVAEE